MTFWPIALPLACLVLQGQEICTTAKDRVGLSATFYQNDLAVVRDIRRITLPRGHSRLAFQDILPSFRPKSASLLDPEDGVQVLERNYEFDLLSPGSLVKASLGLPAWIRGPENTWDKTGVLASLPLLRPRLRAGADPLARIARHPRALAQLPDPKVVVADQEGFRPADTQELAFTRVPTNLRPSPTLLQDLVAADPGPRELTLVYSATGLTWKASYVATLDTDGRHADLVVFATVENRGDGSLPGAILQLVAGDPNILQDDSPRNPDDPRVDTTTVECVAAPSAGPPVFREEKLADFPLFTLDRPTSIPGHSKKQLLLMQVPKVPVAQSFLVESPYQDYALDRAARYMRSETFQPEPETSSFSPIPRPVPSPGDPGGLPRAHGRNANMMGQRHQEWQARHFPSVLRIGRIRNSREAGLGCALPEGDLEFRYQDPVGLELPLTESMGSVTSFPRTPPGTDIEVPLGRASGLKVERRSIDRKVLRYAKGSRDQGRRIAWFYTIEVQAYSLLETPSQVTFREPIYDQWTILQSTVDGIRSGTNAVDFKVKVPAQGKALLRYTVRTQPEAAPAEDPPD